MLKKLFPLLLALLLTGCGKAEIPAADETAAAVMDALCKPYAEEALSWTAAGDCSEAETTAAFPVTITYTDGAVLCEGLAAEVETALAARMEEVTHASELCADGAYLPEILQEAWEAALAERLADRAGFATSTDFTLRLSYSEEGGWTAENEPEIPALSKAIAAEEAKLADIVPAQKTYRLNPYATVGPVPAGEYILCEDAAEIEALLQREEARALINGQPTAWERRKQLKEGATLYAYLDETILALVWQETHAPATLTFAEVFIADGSQLVRKLAEDRFGSSKLIVPTEFARETNAVLLTDGDFYQLRGGYGISVYQGEIQQARGEMADSCFFDREGNMLFAYADQLTTYEAVEQFVAENDIWTGFSFGPIMVDKGVNVCPEYYGVGDYWGELARCGLAQLGERHYLVTTADYFFSVPALADLFIERGAQFAYNLDGGQSSAIILMGEQRNPNIFINERAQSDCIFFATALPET